MHPFKYARPAHSSSAIAAVSAERGASFLAGGTNVIDLMKDDVVAPTLLVDINALPYGEIDDRPHFVRIGALARMSDVADHTAVSSAAPAISEALLLSASPQLRNAASIGGNVMQRTRCTYFRDSASPCNKRTPGNGCAALGGENRMHAILGGSDRCICVHASDLAVALVALDATLRTERVGGGRSIPVREFYRLPETTPQVETVLEHGELIVAVDVPKTPLAARSRYLKIRDRASYEFALVSCAAGVEMKAGRIAAVALAIGAVAPVPWRASEAEALLVGQAPSRSLFERAADVALRGATGHGDNDFKIVMAKRAIVKNLERVTA